MNTHTHKNNKLKHNDNVLIAIPHSFYSSQKKEKEIYTYVNASVVDLKASENFDEVLIQAYCGMNLDVLLTGSLSFEQHQENKDTDVLRVPIGNPNSIHSVLTKVKRSLKGHFTREIYRDMGGVNLKLISNSSDNL